MLKEEKTCGVFVRCNVITIRQISQRRGLLGILYISGRTRRLTEASKTPQELAIKLGGKTQYPSLPDNPQQLSRKKLGGVSYRQKANINIGLKSSIDEKNDLAIEDCPRDNPRKTRARMVTD